MNNLHEKPVLRSIIRMLIQFDEKGIQYCHWKSNEHLAQALCGETDLDVLFLPEQRSLIEQVLNDSGLKRFRAVPLMQYEAIEDFIGYDCDTAQIWHLHTHYRMTLGEKHLKGYTITPWGPYILQNKQLDSSGIYVCCPEVEFVLFLSRLALKKRFRDKGRHLGKDDMVEYEWLQKHCDISRLRTHAVRMLGEKGTEVLMSLCDGSLSQIDQLSKLKKYLRKELHCFTGFNSLSSRLTRTRREFFWGVGGLMRHLNIQTCKPYRRVSPSGGSVVVFLGCDGAGKSTSLSYVQKEFSKKIDVKTIYLGSGDGQSSLLRKPMKWVARRVGGKGLGRAVEKEYNEKKNVSFKSRLYTVAKFLWAITLAGEKKSKLRKITKARNNGMLVLVDRYPQIKNPGYSDGPLLTRYLTQRGLCKYVALWEYKIYDMAAKNMPDLMIKLTVPTEIAIMRKPEMTVEEIQRKKTAINAMDTALHMIEIDTSCPMSESLGKIMSQIWQIV